MYLSNKIYCHGGSGNVSGRLTFDSSDESSSSSEDESSSSSDSDDFSSSDDELSSSGNANYYKKHSNGHVVSSSKARILPSDLVATDKLWPSDKDHLNVYFMNGSTTEQSLVKYLVRKHYNSLSLGIQFNFLSQNELHRSDIRLEFARDSWSRIGTDANLFRNQTTMHVNMHPRRSTEEGVRAKIQADILHEFGHALGMVHAHKHPDCKANWNYQRLMSSNEWSLQNVRRNYDKTTPSVVGKSWDLPYDPKSIMHYAIEKGDTHSRITEVQENTVLSDGDKKMLLRRYPKRREQNEVRTGTKTRHKVSQKLVAPPKEKYKQEPRACEKVYVSGNSSSTVRGGHVVVSGNASAKVKGGGYVVVSGNGKAVVYGDSNVRVSGNGRVYVHGNGTAVVSGNGSARFSGRGTGKTTGNGSISSYV